MYKLLCRKPTSFPGSLSYPSLVPLGRVGENPENEVVDKHALYITAAVIKDRFPSSYHSEYLDKWDGAERQVSYLF